MCWRNINTSSVTLLSFSASLFSCTCSVQYCVQQLCTVQCTHMNKPNRFLDWVLSHWANFTVLSFIFVCVFMYFLYDCILHACDGEMDVVGLKPILRTTGSTSFSALTLSVGPFDPQKPVPDMTYNVFSGTLNPTQATQSFPCRQQFESPTSWSGVNYHGVSPAQVI